MSAQLEQILSFLKELDEQVKSSKPIELYLIGGGAVTLAYDHQNRTSDLDLIEPPHHVVAIGEEFSLLAQKHRVYISPLAEINFSVPSDWRARCHLLELPLKKLQVKVPCVEDIVLGKVARLEPKDFEDIMSLYASNLLQPTALLNRLNENIKELKAIEYRNNCILLFKEVFKLGLIFSKGHLKIKNFHK